MGRSNATPFPRISENAIRQKVAVKKEILRIAAGGSARRTRCHYGFEPPIRSFKTKCLPSKTFEKGITSLFLDFRILSEA